MVIGLAFIGANIGFCQEEEATVLEPSKELRSGRTFSIGFNGGNFIAPVTGVGLEANYFFNSNIKGYFSYSSGTYDGLELVKGEEYTGVSINKFDISASLIEGGIKYFTGNSFYLKGGIGQRNIDFDFETTSTISSVYLNTKIESQSLVIIGGIGNLWSFDSGLYLGGEWLTLHFPIDFQYEFKNTTNAPDSDTSLESLNKDIRDISEKLGKSQTGGVVQLLLGYEF